MPVLHVVNEEKRNINLPRAGSSISYSNKDKRARELAVISVERINIIIDSKTKEQDSLWDQVTSRDQRT